MWFGVGSEWGWKLKQEPDAAEYGVFAFMPSGSERSGACTAQQAKDFLAQKLKQAVFIEVCWERDNLSLGTLLIWLNAQRAIFRLEEHREHYATDPEVCYGPPQLSEAFVNPPENNFKGNTFVENLHRTVTKAQALAAASHWLDTGDRLKSLNWS